MLFSAIQGNNIYSNSRGGIFLKSAVNGNMTVSQNDIHDNARGGLAVRNNCELEITKNNIRNNGWGGIHTGEGHIFAGTLGGAVLTIKQNKIHHHQNLTRGGGIDVRHASGTIENNLVYSNSKGGIRFGDYVSEIKNNTVVNNGNDTQDAGGGIIYDDPAIGNLEDSPDGTLKDSPNYPDPLIRNNIAAYNEKAGMRVGGNGYDCPDNPIAGDSINYRDHNLAYANNGTGETDCGYPDSLKKLCASRNCGECGAIWNPSPPPFVILAGPNDMIADPLFKNMGGDDYRLQRVSEGDPNDSPAIGAGDDNSEMGAYGGSDPLVDTDIPQF